MKKAIVLLIMVFVGQSIFSYSEKAVNDLKEFKRLVGKKPEDRDLSGVRWPGFKPTGNFSNVNFTGAFLKNGNFYNALLFNTNFTDAKLDNSNFGGAKLDNANFTNALLFKTDYYDASLKNAKFNGADLTQANFKHADLTNADFTDADLSGAILSGAFNVKDANFKGADVSGVHAMGETYVIDLSRPNSGHSRFIITKKWLREKGAINVYLANCRD